jgi:hypothetical protein
MSFFNRAIPSLFPDRSVAVAAKTLQVALILLFSALTLFAQEANSDASSNSVNSSEAQATVAESEPHAQAAADLTSDLPPFVTHSDEVYQNMLLGGYRLSGAYDRYGGTHFFEGTFAPHIALQETRSTMRFSASYAPGIEAASYSNSTQLSQSANGTFDWTPMRHLQIHLRQDYSVTINPFARIQDAFVISQLGPLLRPNDYVITNDTRPRMLDSEAGVSYALDAHTNVGFSGSFVDRSYDNLSNLQSSGSALLAGDTSTASASFSHQFSATQTSGLQFVWSDLSFSDQSQTHAYGLLYSQTMKLTPRMALTLYAGPQYSSSYSLSEINLSVFALQLRVKQHGWSPACGGTYNWTGDRNAFRVEFMRRVSDGGGLMGAITLTGGSAQFRRNFSSLWAMNLGLNLSDNQALGLLPGTQEYLRTEGGSLGLQRRLSDKTSVQLSYSRVWQSGQIQLYAPGTQDRVEFGMEYHFTRPVGR